MQDFDHEENLANQMGFGPALGLLPDTYVSGGTEAGLRSRSTPTFPVRCQNIIPNTTAWNDTRNGQYAPSTITQQPTTSDAITSWCSSSLFAATQHLNSALLPAFGDGSCLHCGNPVRNLPAVDQLHELACNNQEQTVAANGPGVSVSGFGIGNNDFLHGFDCQLSLYDAPMYNNAMNLPHTGAVPIQSPVGHPFPNDLSFDVEGAGHLDISIVDSSIPIICMQPSCLVTFKRDTDRIRHETAVHGINQLLHLCPVPGCVKGQGKGYTRKDKLTEHLWKKHGNLGFAKRV